MRNLFLVLIVCTFFACKKEGDTIAAPTDVSQVSAEPRIGGAVIKWDLPADSNFLYLEVRYLKKDVLQKIKVSKYTDSLVVTGLLNKLSYDFEVQAFNASKDKVVGGEIFKTASVQPIRRPVEVTYFKDQLTRITDVTADMLDTYTQESTEGPKANLVDGNINTYWHSSWSDNVAPLPHWITLQSATARKIGVVKYNLRQSSDKNGRPSQLALEISNDGVKWERVWTSKDGLSVEPITEEKTVDFGANYTAKYHKLLIVKTPGMTTYTHLSEISYYTMAEELVDTEVVAETNY